MLGIDRRLVQNFDWTLFCLVFSLVAIGIVNLISSTHSTAGMSDEVRRQLISLGIGCVGLVATVAIDYRHFERFAVPIFVASLLLLVAALVLAPVTRGSQSWLFGGRLQPSELVKISLVLMLARFFQRNPPGEIRRIRDLIRPIGIAGLPVALIVLSRDTGVALLTVLIASTYLAFVRIPWRGWAAVALLGVAAFAALWTFFLAPYQQGRILDVIDPGRDPLASGYQVIQSRIAVGSGGLLGKGWVEGTQSQLQFLPTQHTDFAFSVLAEEWGFLGSSIVLSLYALMLLWGLFIARNSKDAFGAMLAIGVVGILFWPAVLNIGMVLGVMPVIGVPLPLFAYGGSALVTALVAVGLLMNVSLRRYVF